MRREGGRASERRATAANRSETARPRRAVAATAAGAFSVDARSASIALRLAFASDHSATPASRASAAATSDAGDDKDAVAARNRETYAAFDFDFSLRAAVVSGSFASACSA